MFATRRSLSEATTKIAKELENVYSSISVILSSLYHNLLTLKSVLYAYAVGTNLIVSTQPTRPHSASLTM